MGRKSTNGLTDDFRYKTQQRFINEVAQAIGCVAFRPDYHADTRDANTVLLYLPEDAQHNREVDMVTDRGFSKDEAKLYHLSDERYIYRDYFWAFQNTDVNGLSNLDFANHGTLDLRGLNWKEKIEASIRSAWSAALSKKAEQVIGTDACSV